MAIRLRMFTILVLLALLSACGQAGDTGQGGAGGAGSSGAAGGSAATSAPAGDAAPTTAADAAATIAPATEATSAPATEATTESATEATSAPAGDAAANSETTIRLGSKNFTEVLIVGEMQALLLENAGFTVERNLNLGATPVAHTALINDEIDLYAEYTSTGLQEVLNDTERYADAEAVYNAVRAGYEEQFGLTWLEPAPFNNTNTFAVTEETAQQYGLRTYSDLAARASELRLGGPPEFPDREDTQGLYEAYGGFEWAEFRQLDTGSLRYDALLNGDIDVVVAFGTDGRIAGDNLVVLEDDKGYYPVYQLAPVVRSELLETNPQIAEVLNQLAPLLTDEVMAGLNYQVDGPEQMDPADVAAEFLREQGLVQ
jgi:osmoprotectant transport system substrate-binding protein